MNKYVMSLVLLVVSFSCSAQNVVSDRYSICTSLNIDRNSSPKSEDVDAVTTVVGKRKYGISVSYFLDQGLHDMALRHPALKSPAAGNVQQRPYLLMDVFLNKPHRVLAITSAKARALFIDISPSKAESWQLSDLARISESIVMCKIAPKN